MSLNLVVVDDLQQAVEAARDRTVRAAAAAIAARGTFLFVVDGGRASQKLYGLLAAEPQPLPWERTVVLLGDDRRVVETDPRSNRGLVERLLLAPLPRRPRFIAPDAAAADGSGAAAAFAAAFARETATTGGGADLQLLGLGPDGHVASLFPNAAAPADPQALAVAVDPPVTVEPHVARLTLTRRAILAAGELLVFAIGAEKRTALARLLADVGNEAETPGRMVRGHPRATVVADRAAVG